MCHHVPRGHFSHVSSYFFWRQRSFCTGDIQYWHGYPCAFSSVGDLRKIVHFLPLCIVQQFLYMSHHFPSTTGLFPIDVSSSQKMTIEVCLWGKRLSTFLTHKPSFFTFFTFSNAPNPKSEWILSTCSLFWCRIPWKTFPHTGCSQKFG